MHSFTITLLGTSHGDPTRGRYNSAVLAEFPDEALLIDAGTPVLASLIRRDFPLNKLRRVIITHMHEDHFGGLPDLLKFQSKRQAGDYTLEVLLPEAGAEAGIRAFMNLAHRPLRDNIIFRTYGSGMICGGGYRLEAIPTDHFSNEGLAYPSYALKLTAEGKNVLFTGDLSADLHDLPLGIGAELCFCELTHYLLEKGVARFRSQPWRELVFTHIGNEWQTAGSDVQFRALTAGLPFPCHIAVDGEEFRL